MTQLNINLFVSNAYVIELILKNDIQMTWKDNDNLFI